jgi:hypothetical protein
MTITNYAILIFLVFLILILILSIISIIITSTNINNGVITQQKKGGETRDAIDSIADVAIASPAALVTANRIASVTASLKGCRDLIYKSLDNPNVLSHDNMDPSTTNIKIKVKDFLRDVYRLGLYDILIDNIVNKTLFIHGDDKGLIYLDRLYNKLINGNILIKDRMNAFMIYVSPVMNDMAYLVNTNRPMTAAPSYQI